MNIMMKNIEQSLYTQNTKSTYNNPVDDIKGDLIKESVQQIKEAIEKTCFVSDEEKKKYEDKLYKKVEAGDKLTQSEMEYIRKTNPMLYTRVKRVQMQREALEMRLKQCRSKNEVQQAYAQAMSSIPKKDPDKEMVINAYNHVTKEFKSTNQYKNLPQDIENKNGKKETRFEVKA